MFDLTSVLRRLKQLAAQSILSSVVVREHHQTSRLCTSKHGIKP